MREERLRVKSTSVSQVCLDLSWETCLVLRHTQFDSAAMIDTAMRRRRREERKVVWCRWPHCNENVSLAHGTM